MKILRIGVVLLLMLGSFGVCADADDMFSEKEILRYENNIGFLDKIGVMEYSDNITETVTRAEFAKILTSISGIDSYTEYKTSFADVGQDTEYAKYIHNAYALGLMNGYDDKTFGPEDTLTYEQAIYGLVRVLGYGNFIENTAEAYSSKASELKLYDRTYGEATYPITYGSLSMMVMNTLNSEVLIYEPDGRVTKSNDETLLETVFELERKSGIVTSSEKTSLNEPDGAGRGNIGIDNEVYVCGENSDDYLGYYIDYYISSEDEVVYITKNLNRNDDFEISADVIESYSNREYTYTASNGRTKKEKIPTGCSVIYNGRAISEEVNVNMNIKNGSLLFIDNNNDGKYDVIKVTDIKSIVAGTVDGEKHIVWNKFDSGDVYDFDRAYDNGMLILKNYQGLECAVSDISDGNTLSIIMSADGKAAEITVGRAKVNGTIDKYSEDSIGIDGEEYPVREGELGGEIEFNKSGTLYIDVYGYAIYFDGRSADMHYGYFTKAFYDPEADGYGIRIYDFDTALMKTLYFNNKVKADGKSTGTSEQYLRGLHNADGTDTPQIIGYQTNSADKIIKLDTLFCDIGAEGADTLRLLTTASDVGYRSEMSCFRDGKTFTTASTMYIKIPEDPSNLSEDEFMVYSAGELSNDGKYDFNAYQTGSNQLGVDYVLFTSMENISIIGLVKDVRLYADDGEINYEVRLCPYSGAEITTYAEPDYIEKAHAYNTGSGSYEIGKGDVISYTTKTDSSGISRITDAQIIFDYDGGGYLLGANPYISWGSAGVNFYAGNVYMREGNLIGMTDEDVLGSEKDYTTNELQLLSLDRGTIFKAEKGRKLEIVTGSASDVLDYKSVGSKHSKVFVLLTSLVPRMIYIYD